MLQAALGQAEELWDAATVAGYASRPIPLFYALSQAGRAICAAWIESDEWRPRGHGLKRQEETDGDPTDRVLGYGAEVTPHRLGIFAMVAGATGSTTFTGSASVGDLWVSLPGFPRPKRVFGQRRRWLLLQADSRPISSGVDGFPLTTIHLIPRYGVFQPASDGPPPSPEEYPTTVGAEIAAEWISTVGGHKEIVYAFRDPGGALKPLSDVGEPLPGEKTIPHTLFAVRPKVGTTAVRPPSQFMTLWALLFCLSELARYYPDTWVRALDTDHSEAAVTIEHGLDVALERAPELIASALARPITNGLLDELRAAQPETGGEEPPAPER